MFFHCPQLLVEDCRFERNINSAGECAAALQVASNIKFQGFFLKSTFAGNSQRANNGGGALILTVASNSAAFDVLIAECRFLNCSSAGNGGALLARASEVVMTFAPCLLTSLVCRRVVPRAPP